MWDLVGDEVGAEPAPLPPPVRQPATRTGRRRAMLGTLTRRATYSKVRVCAAVTRS